MAAQLMFKKQISNANLAAAAAGTAYTSRPTTPTAVADVQTKRTMKRSNSVSSQGSTAVMATGRPGSGLERRGSSGSMSERSFRDQSPARSQSVSVPHDAPPVPAIPKNIAQQPAIPQKSTHRRTASLEAPPMRVTSPPPNKSNGRGSSLGPVAQSSPPRRQRNSSLASVQETERPSSRGSVNFSLPTSFRPISPMEQKRLTYTQPQRVTITSPANQNLVYDPNSRRFLPQSEVDAIEQAIDQRIYDAANASIPKKKRFAPKQATGTHLTDGTVNGRPKGTAVDAMEAAAQQQPKPVELPAAMPEPPTTNPAAPEIPTLSPARKKKKKKAVMSDSESDNGSYMPNSSDNDSDYPPRPKEFSTRAGTFLAKKPSVVREDREREEEEDDTPSRPKVQEGLKLDTSPAIRAISPTPLPRSQAGRGHGRGQASSSAAFAQDRQQARAVSQPPPSSTESSPSSGSGIGLHAKDSVKEGRVASVSPARTHFGAVTSDALMVKHQPPGRSISPRKSALKHSNSPRSGSPVPGVVGHVQEPTEGSTLSNVSTVGSDDLVVPRKKANRVSFDDSKVVVVGEVAPPVSSDSPVAASPQTRKWLGFIGRGKKKELPVEDDEVMQPRPALPSFGSVREKKPTREVEERPLVKPTEPVEQKPSEPIPLHTSPTSELIQNPLGQSNDFVVGSVLAQDAATKNAANISKSREPLPPQVTSVEGSGDISESDTSDTDLAPKATETTHVEGLNGGPNVTHVDTSKIPITSKPEDESEDEADGARTPTGPADPVVVNSGIPQIALFQPTPTLDETYAKREWPDMPGSWGGSSDSESDNNQIDDSPPRDVVEHHATDPKPSDIGIAEPDPIAHVPGAPAVGTIAAENSIPEPILEEPESEADSIYSDAAEDLSDLEGDGFMSLDAVVESPVPKRAVPVFDHPRSSTPDSPTTKSTKVRAYEKSKLSHGDSEPEVDEGWDRVQAYWSTLSADRKKELEREAREAMEEDSDTETEVKPAPKPKSKKKTPLKPALKPATAPIPIATSGMVPERTYMIQPGAKAGPNGHPPTMRSSMRAEPANTPEETHIRKSMRGPAGKRTSLRASAESEPRGALQKKHRPMSYPVNEVHADPAAVQNHVLALSAASAKQAQRAAQNDLARPVPTLRRKGSGDSDSSFKRARPSSSNDIPSFRRSMRGPSEAELAERPTSPPRSSRFSLRSLSPTGSGAQRPFNSAAAPPVPPVNPTHMRMSMRNSRDSAPSLRQNSASRLGNSSKPSKKAAPKPQSRSRFADSSDEDEPRPVHQSRFVDSSDEDEPAPARGSTMRNSMRSAPVRGIPKRTGVEDGDSSDLPDSDDEAKTPSSPGFRFGKKNKKANTVTNGAAQGATLASGSLRRSGSGRETLGTPATTVTTASGPARPDNKRRGSFMSSILRRKKVDPESKVRKTDIESAARRDTPLERSKSELSVLRTERVGSPKLQKRNTMSRENSASWPLPASPVTGPPALARASSGVGAAGLGEKAGDGGDGVDGRPFTSDGMAGLNGVVGGEDRPDIGTRRFTATGLTSVDVPAGDDSSVVGAVVPGKKKKKFGALRRMFKLDD